MSVVAVKQCPKFHGSVRTLPDLQRFPTSTICLNRIQPVSATTISPTHIMGFFDTVLDLFTPVVYADDNQAADELQSGSGKAYGNADGGNAHVTPDSKPNADAQKGTEQSSADLTGTPKETDSSDKPFQGKADDDEEEEEEASDDAGGDDEEEEEEEDEPVDPMPRLLQGESIPVWCGVNCRSVVALVALNVL